MFLPLEVDGPPPNNQVISSQTSAHSWRWLADILWPAPLKFLAQRPRSVLLIWAVTNGLFVSIGEIIALMVNLLTLPGFFIVVAIAIYVTAFNIARSIVYPGHLSTVSRSLEKEMALQVKRSVQFIVDLLIKVLEYMLTMRGRLHEHRCQTDILKLINALDTNRETILSPLETTLKSFFHDSKSEYENSENEKQQVLVALCNFNKALGLLSSELLVQLVENIKNGRQDSASALLETCFAGISLADLAGEPYENAEDIVDYRASKQLVLQCVTTASKLRRVSLFLADRESIISECADESDESSDTTIQEESDVEPEGNQWLIVKSFQDWQLARSPFKAVASIDFLRADLLSKFGGRQRWIESFDGTKLDTIFLPGKFPGKFQDNRTMLLCNPNCGIYEFSGYQSQWLRFYHEQGINVMMYNYRGYGRSEGWPHPFKLQRDGEAILDHLVKVENVERIGIHAESIGGVVACHLLAHQNLVSLLIADRTFCDLAATAESLVGNWAGKAIRALGWQVDNVDVFLSSPVYKVCTCDPNDEIISDHASLKSGIARRLVDVASDPSLSSISPNASKYAAEYVGADNVWLNNHDFYIAFGDACHMLIAFGKEHPVRSIPGASQLETQLNVLLKLLLVVDGKCGMCLSGPIFDYMQRSQRSETVSHNRLKDWFCCLVVWGRIAPCYGELVKKGTHDLMHYDICGFKGVFGTSRPCTVEHFLEILKEFLLQNAVELDRLELLNPLNLISSSLLKAFHHHDSSVSSVSTIHLLPLSCGHNNHMSEAETAQVTRHLEKAGW